MGKQNGTVVSKQALESLGAREKGPYHTLWKDRLMVVGAKHIPMPSKMTCGVLEVNGWSLRELPEIGRDRRCRPL